MASARKSVRFNEYINYLLEQAEARGWGKTELMRRCGIPRQRWSEFRGDRALTGRYFLKFMEGLHLNIDAVEKGSGIKMSDDQRREIQIESWQSAHRDLIEAMIDNPALVNVLKAAIRTIQ